MSNPTPPDWSVPPTAGWGEGEAVGAGRARVEAAAGGWDEEAGGDGEGQRHWLVSVKGEG